MRRLMLLATGSVTAAMLPYQLRSLRASRPDLEVRVGLTTSARRFVTPRSLALLSGHATLDDAWAVDESRPRAEHVELEEWAEAFVVYPATAHMIARLRLGLCDTPFLTALSSTRKPIGIAPSVPPGMTQNPAFTEHCETLRTWPNVVLASTRQGTSVSNGRTADGAAGPLTEVVDLVEQLLTARPGERPVAGEPMTWSGRPS